MSANDELQAHTCEKVMEFYGDVANNVAQANSQGLQTGYDILKEYEAHKTPVPSYEEWRSTGKFAMEAIKVAEENQQLKELLNQWVKFYPIVLYEHEDTLKVKDIIELFEKTIFFVG